MAGKGDNYRPVNKEKYDENYDRIFGAKKPYVPFIAVAIVPYEENGVEHHLIVKRQLDAKRFPGTWSRPGGGSQEGESPVDTAARELFEETQIRGFKGSVVKTIEVRLAASGEPIQMHFVRFPEWSMHGEDGKVVLNKENVDYGWLLSNL